MASPATEVAYISLKPGLDLEGATSQAETWQEALSTIGAQKGYQRLYWGRQIEDPDVLLLVIDWDSVDSHTEFIANPAYGPFKETLGKIMTGVHLHHFQSKPHPPLLGKAPCTEVATFYGCEDDFGVNVAKFAQAIDEGRPEGYVGIAYGNVIEKTKKHADVANDDIEKSDGFVLLIGWESKELHLKFREAELFKKIVYLLREKNGGAEVFHVPFKAV